MWYCWLLFGLLARAQLLVDLSCDTRPTATSLICSANFTTPVPSFTQFDVNFTNSSIDNFSGGPSSFTFTVRVTIPIAIVTVFIRTGAVTNNAGEQNAASQLVVIYHDVEPLTVALTQSRGVSPTRKSPLDIIASFNKNVTGLNLGKFLVTSATLSNLAPSTNNTYTFQATPSSSCVTVRISLPANSLRDISGNQNRVSSELAIQFDSDPPLIQSLAPLASITDVSSISVIPLVVTFTEAVKDFTANSISVGNGTVSNFRRLLESKYSFDVTPVVTAEVVNVRIPANVATDAAGNKNSASFPLQIARAVRPLIVTFTAPAITNSSPIPVSIDFSSPATPFRMEEITVTNGTISRFNFTSTQRCDFNVIPISSVTPVTLSLPERTTSDIMGNLNSLTEFSIDFDSSAPVAQFSVDNPRPVQNAPIVDSPIHLIISISKQVKGNISAAFTVLNARAEGFQLLTDTPYSVYSVNLVPDSPSCIVQVSLRGSLIDLYGNLMRPSSVFEIVYDTVPPAARLSTPVSSPVASSPIAFGVSFGEAVQSMKLQKISVTGGYAHSLAMISSSDYTFQVSPFSSSGPVTVQVLADAAKDLAGFSSGASSTISLNYDSDFPLVVLSSSTPNPGYSPIIPVNATFSKEVEGFSEDKVVVTGGRLRDFVRRSGSRYDFNIFAEGDQARITVDIPANVASDSSGNFNTNASQLLLMYDALRPQIAVRRASNTTKKDSTGAIKITVIISCSEEVRDLSNEDISLSGPGLKGSFSQISQSDYSLEIMLMSTYANLTVSVMGGAASDLAGNLNEASNALSIVYDSERPYVNKLSTTADSPTFQTPVLFTLRWSEDINMNSSHISVIGGSVKQFFSVSSTDYSFSVDPDSNFTLIIVSVAEGVTRDSSDNLNLASAPLSVLFDAQAPTVTRLEAINVTGPFTQAPLAFILEFSEPVLGLVASDLLVKNGVISRLVSGINTGVWTFNVIPISSTCVIEISVPASVCTDRAKNANAASAVKIISFDSDPPVVTFFGTTQGLVTNRSLVPVRIIFSEAVRTLITSSVSVTAGRVDSVKEISPVEYELTVIPSGAQGDVVLTLSPNSVLDRTASLPNVNSYSFSISYDSVPPQVTMKVEPSDGSFQANVSFSEAVSGFSSTSVSLVNATIGAFRQNNASEYSFLIYPQTSRSVVGFGIPAQVAFDSAGNGNVALSTPYSLDYDNESPLTTVSVVGTTSSSNFQNPIPVTINFSKPCFGFTPNDKSLIVVNGIPSTVEAVPNSNNQIYTVIVAPYPPTEAIVSVSAPEGVCVDSSGNPNREGEPVMIIRDSVSPEVLSIESNTPNPGNITPLPITVRFSEVVNGFGLDSILVVGGTINPSPPFTTNSEFSFKVTPQADSIIVSISIVSSGITDRFGNNMVGTFSASFVYDNTKPTARLTVSATATSQSPATVSLLWSERVMPFKIENVARITNGVVGNLIKVSDLEYTFDVYPFQVNTPSPAVAVSIWRTRVFDFAGNANIGSPEVNILFTPKPGDSPLQAKLSTATNPAFTPLVQITAEWNYPVTDFQLSGVTVAGGQASDFTANSDNTYRFTVVPIAGADFVTVQIPDSAVRYNGAWNHWNSNKLNISFETKTAVSISTGVSITNKAPILFSAQFTRPMLFFNSSCVEVKEGRVHSVIPTNGDKSLFAFYVIPDSFFATIAVSMVQGCPKDFNENVVEQALLPIVLQYDIFPPSVVISPSGTSGAIITFNKTIVGDFTADDVYVSGGNISTFTDLKSTDLKKSYSITVTPFSAKSLVTIRVFSGIVADPAGNLNTASNTLALTSGSLPPIVSLWGLSPTNAPITVTIATSKPSTLVSSSLITLGGTVSGFTAASSGTSFEVVLTPPMGSLFGSITLQVPSGAVTDQIGSKNIRSVATEINYDYSLPEVVAFASNVALPTSQSPIPVIITFSKPVTNFSAGSLLIEGGTFTISSGNRTTYYLAVYPAASTVNVLLRLPSRSVRDIAGNVNVRSSTLTLSYNAEPPRVQSLETDVTSPSSSPTISVLIRWTTNVTGFDMNSCEVSGAVKQNFEKRSNSSFLLKLIPNATVGNITLTIQPRTVLSFANQPNIDVAQILIVHDAVGPTILLTTPVISPSSTSQIPVLVTINEPVPNFDIGKLLVVGGPISEFVQKTDTQYEFKVLLISSGEDVTIEVAGGACADFARNPSAPSQRLTITHDAEPPFVQSWSFPQNKNPTKISPIATTITFNKPVNNFTSSALWIEGATLEPLSFVSVSQSQIYQFSVKPLKATSNVLLRVLPQLRDTAGNLNLESSVNVLFDSVVPEVSSLEMVGSSQRLPIPFVMYWTEKVLDFTISDFVVTGGSITRFVEISSSSSSSTTTTKYAFDVMPSTLISDIVISIKANAVQDLAGNFNKDSRLFTFAHDAEPILVLALEILVNDPATETPIPGSVLFSKPVTDFGLNSFQNGTEGCELQNLVKISDREYHFDIVPLLDEVDLRLRLPPDSVHDQSGKSNAESDDLRFRYDSLPPVITFDSTVSSPTALAQFPLSIHISEPLKMFAETDVKIEMATIIEFVKTSSTLYLLTLAPLASSVQVKVSVSANTVQDVAGHGNVASDIFVMACDKEPPRVQLSTVSLATVSSPVVVRAEFTEQVVDFTMDMFVVVGGTVDNFRDDSNGAGSSYAIDITPLLRTANITVNLAANTVRDAAGNRNLAATQLSIVYDIDFPSVQISANSSRIAPLIAYADWSEPVNKFSLDHVTTDKAVAFDLVQQSPTRYQFKLLPACSNVRIQIDVDSGVFSDIAGNTNAGARSTYFSYDADPPNIQSLTTTAGSITKSPSIPVNVVFSEPVSGFTLANINVTNATSGSFRGIGTGSSAFTFQVMPTVLSGWILIEIPAGSTKDIYDNPNLPAIPLSIFYDAEPPTILSLTTSLSNPISSNSIPVTVVFSEAVTELKMSAITVVVSDNGSAKLSKLSQKTPTSYTFILTPGGQYGHIKLLIRENSVQDGAGNGNAASPTLEIDYDANPPTVVLSTTEKSPSKATVVQITATFSKPVNLVDVNKVSVTSCTAKNLMMLSRQVAIFDVVPSGNYAQVSIQFASGITQDAANNRNLPSNVLTFVHDSVRPDVLRLSGPSTPTNLTRLPFQIVFSKAVVPFSAGSISVANGAIVDLMTVAPDTYTFIVVPSSPVTRVRVELKGAEVTDAAGNANTPSEVVFIDSDSQAPSVKITSSVPSPTSISFIPFTISWSELVSGFNQSNFEFEGCIFHNFTQIDSSNNYILVVQTQGVSAKIVVRMKPNSVQDSAGNWNADATSGSVFFDIGPLIVTLSTTDLLPASSTVRVICTFNKEVSKLSLDQLIVVNGYAEFVGQASNTEYQFDVKPNSPTTVVQVSVPERVVQDKANNYNRPSAVLSLPFDSDPPNVTYFGTATGKTITSANPFQINVTFSERILNFTVDSILYGYKANGIFDMETNTFTCIVFASATPPFSIVTLEIKANTFQDLAGNRNRDSYILRIKVDTFSPEVRLSSPAPIGPSATKRYLVWADFTEQVQYFGPESLTLSGATADNFVVVWNNTQTQTWRLSFELTPLSQSQLINVSVNQGKFSDWADNKNFASNLLQFTHDSLSLQVIDLRPIPMTPTHSMPIPFSLIFSADVVENPCASINITNATIENCRSLSNSSYVFDAKPRLDYATIRVYVPAGVTGDRASNRNLLSETVEVIFDRVAPKVVSLTAPSKLPTNIVPIPFEIVFSEPVFGLQASSFTVIGGAVSQLRAGSSPNVHRFIVIPNSSSGSVSVSFTKDQVTDAADNFNTAYATSVVVAYDSDPPGVTLKTVPDNMNITRPLSAERLQISCYVTKKVNDLQDASVVSIMGGTIEEYEFVSTTFAKFYVRPLFASVVMTISLDENAIHDDAGNGNIASLPLVVRFDRTPPSVVISHDATARNLPFEVTLFFSETVTGISRGSLSVDGATVVGFSSSLASQYKFNLSPIADVIRVSVPAGSAFDDANLPNIATSPLIIQYGARIPNCGSDGPVTINRTNVNQFLHCTEIRNDTTIDPSMPRFNFPNLLTIIGDLTVSGTSWEDMQGFYNLVSVSRTVSISNNLKMKSLKGLSNLYHVASISLRQLPLLSDVNGLHKKLNIDNALIIEQCRSLSSLVGLCGVIFLSAGQASFKEIPRLCCAPVRDLLSMSVGFRGSDLDTSDCAATCSENNNFYCDHCKTDSCNFHGKCTSTNYGFECDCDASFRGSTCSESIAVQDRCSPNPCQNGGTCSNGICSCAPSYSGPTCLQVADTDSLILVAETAVSVSRLGGANESSLDVGVDNMAFLRFVISATSDLLRAPRGSIQTATLKLFYPASYSPPASVHSVDFLSPTDWTSKDISWTSRPPVTSHDDWFPIQWKSADKDFIEVDVSPFVLSVWGTTSTLSFQITCVNGSSVSYQTSGPSLRPQLTIQRAKENGVPSLQYARYSNLSPRYILVAFNLDTNWRKLNLNNTEWCKQIFSPQSLVDLTAGSNSALVTCRWINDRQLIMKTSSTVYSESSSLQLRASDLRNQAQTSARVMGGAVQIQPVPYAIPPIVSLVGPSTISTCTDFTIDASASLNLLSQQPLVEWFLNGAPFSTGKLQLFVLGQTLQQMTMANFSVSITNGYGQRASASLKITVQKQRTIPVVTILTSSQVLTSQDLILEPIIEFSGCAKDYEQATNLQFLWSLKYESIPTANVLSNPTERELIILKGTLSAGATYTFALQVSSSNPTASFITQALATFSVVASPLVAIISQGSRVVTPGNLTLDASASYDPDDPLLSRSSSWSFYWSCQLINTAASSFSVSTRAAKSSLCEASTSSAKLVDLRPGFAYRVSVHFTDSRKSDRHAFDSVVIEVANSLKMPLVTIRSSTATENNYLLQGSAISLLGTSNLDMKYLWTITLNGNKASLADLQLDNLPLDAPFLVVPKPIDTNEYLFLLSVSEPSSSSAVVAASPVGSSWVRLKGDVPPFDGNCTIASSGVAFVTMFTYRCFGWQSSLSPVMLRYNFRFVSMNRPELAATELVKDSHVPFFQFHLPVGNWVLIAEIVDLGGSIAYISNNVSVSLPSSMQTSQLCFVQTTTSSLVIPAVEQNNTARLFYLISLLSDILNTECSNSNGASSSSSLSCLLSDSSSLDLQRQLRGKYLDLILDVKDGVLPAQNKQIARALASLSSSSSSCQRNDPPDFTNKIMSLLDDQINRHYDIMSAGDLLDSLSNLAASVSRCMYTNSIQSLSKTLAQKTVENVLVGQTATIESLNVKLAVQRLLVRNKNASLSLASSSVYFSSLNWTDAPFVDVVLAQFGRDIIECKTQKDSGNASGADRNLLAASGSTDIASDLLRVQLIAGDQMVPLSSPIVFSLAVVQPLPLSPNCPLNTEPRCVWWNAGSSFWSEQFCEVTDFRPSSDKSGRMDVVCKCSILADFAVRFARLPQLPCYVETNIGFIGFAIVYMLAWLFCLWRLRKWSLFEAACIHSVFFVVCACRAILAFYLSGVTDWYPLWSHVAILTAIPQVVLFCLLTKRILTWMSNTNDAHRMRIITYVIYALLLLSLVMAFFGPVMLVVGEVGVTLIAVACILYPLSFVIMVACRYYRYRGTTEAAHQGVTSINLACFCLIVSALAWLIALYSEGQLRSASVTMIIYLIFDLLAVIILLRINYFSFATPRLSQKLPVYVSTGNTITRRESAQLARMPSAGRIPRPLPSTPLPDIDLRFDDSVSGSHLDEIHRTRPTADHLFPVDEHTSHDSETNEMMPVVSMKFASEKYDEESRRMDRLVSFDECSKEDLDDMATPTPSSIPLNFRSPDSRDFVAHLHTPSPIPQNPTITRRDDRRDDRRDLSVTALDPISILTPSQEMRFNPRRNDNPSPNMNEQNMLLTPPFPQVRNFQSRYRSPPSAEQSASRSGMHLQSLKESAHYEDIADLSE